MKTKRSMILVSNDPHSLKNGAEDVYQALATELKSFNLQDEISLSKVSDISRKDISPFVIVYPEAVIYGDQFASLRTYGKNWQLSRDGSGGYSS